MKMKYITGLLMVLLLVALIPAVSAEAGLLDVIPMDVISGEPVSGDVYVDGAYAGFAMRHLILELEPGMHEVYVEPLNPYMYQSSPKETVEVFAPEDGRMAIHWAFLFPAYSEETGHIYVHLVDEKGGWIDLPAKVLLNGVETGKEGNQGIHELPVDEVYKVKVMLDGYTAEPKEQVVQFAEGGMNLEEVTFTLTKETKPPVVPAPEFPTASIPALFLIGMIGVIFLIRTRES